MQQVFVHQAHRQFLVARGQGLDDVGVFVVRVFGGLVALVHEGDQGAARDEFAQQLGQHLVAHELGHAHVEVAQQLGAAGHVLVVDRELFPSQTVFGFAILDKLRDLDIKLVVLAGFDCELTQPIFKHYSGRIIDTYSSLMPAFTDEELSGIKIQEAELNAGVKISGATVFFVTEKPNFGPIILQKAVAVREGDSPAVLQRRILEEAENVILPRAVELYCGGKLSVVNGIVYIAEPTGSDSEKMTK